MLVVAGFGLALLYISGNPEWWKDQPALKAFLSQLGGVMIAAVGLALLWENVGKRRFADEILVKAGIAQELDQAGILRATDEYLKIDWDDYFSAVSELDIFFAYGRTWRNSHRRKLAETMDSKAAKVRVFLPDTSDDLTITNLSSRFAMTPAQLKFQIHEAARDFFMMESDSGAELEIYFRRGDQTFSCYRFDRMIVVTLYTHSKKRMQVPTFVFRKGGSMFEFFGQELEQMPADARRISMTDLPKERGDTA
jgi:hypothetical protein